LKIKHKGHHFDTILVIEAESQAMLSTLTEHDFQEHSKWCIHAEGNYIEGYGGQ
jgi:hypothetical protein